MSLKQENRSFLRQLISWTAWPVLFGACLLVTYYGFEQGHPLLFFNFAYLGLAVSLLLLERAMPHEKSWLNSDGQIWANIGHTLTSKGTIQALLLFGGVIGLSELIKPASEPSYGIWPRDIAMFWQVLLGLVLSEFGLYWAHRLAHEWPFLWKFHAVHHSVTKLWIVNTGRFHFVDSLVSIVLGSGILFALGAPMELIQWLSAITAFIGMLTHCNVEMRFGPLSWVFNTPELHRWHHSKNIYDGGNMNYCENIMIWDHAFDTFYNPPYRPPVDIGIKEIMPPKFKDQILFPFKHKPKPKDRIMDFFL